MKRVLAVWYSQTGQMKRCMESFLAPLREAHGEVEVDLVELQPETPYPFPWGMRAFLSVFSQSVLAEPAPIRPPAIDPSKKYDLVVLGLTVWYLSPAPPVVAFLRSPQAEALKDTPVVVLSATRNMWQRGWNVLKGLVAARGGKIIDHVGRIDQGPDWASFYTTPRWLIAGHKENPPFPTAGVSDKDIAELRAPGQKVLAALRAGPVQGSVFGGQGGLEAIEVRRRYLLPELGAKALFRLWAKLIKAAPEPLKYPLGLVWFCWLVSSLPLAIPIALTGEILNLTGSKWYRERLQELVEPSGGAIR
ncbi:MAG: hypothetical protein QM765_45370 [Myxococcales bacterium]